MIQFLDTHAHLQFPVYDTDREEVLARMRSSHVGAIVVGTDRITSANAVMLARDTDDLWATIGVHPNDAVEGFDEHAYETLLSPRTVGVGECGLDYFRSDKTTDGLRQKNLFEAQVAFAAKHHLALMLHVRPSSGTQDAHEDTLAILEQYARTTSLRGTAHFFTGSAEVAQRYWALGFSTSFPGTITFTDQYDDVVRAAPQELILAETDAPYAAPVPHRGHRNEPMFVIHTIERIAVLRKERPEDTRGYLLANASRIFGLKLPVAPVSGSC